MVNPPNPYLEEKTQAQEDLAQWRAFLAGQVNAKPKPKRVGPPSLASSALWKLQKGRCWICGQPLDNFISRDHLHPRSKGGLGKRDNILLAHRRCDSGRGNDWIYTQEEALQILNSGGLISWLPYRIME